MRAHFRILGLITLSAISCTFKKDHIGSFSHEFVAGEKAGVLDNEKINEASGLDASISNAANTFWTHNDSQGEAKLFLIDHKGRYIGSALLEGISNRDWEDITTGPGPDSTKNYVYVGDIGDNRAIYDVKYIYRIEEPILQQGNTVTIQKVDSIRFKLPDARRDAEALFIDQQTKDLYLFSKREERINLYILPYPQSIDSVITATLVANLPLTQLVAADYDAVRGELLAKNYDSVYYWKKQAHESISMMLTHKPLLLPYVSEPQGEALCFDSNGDGYYSLSEAKKGFVPTLFFYKRK